MPIVQYWDSGRPPGYVADLLATFRERNPDMSHRVFDEAEAAEFIVAHFGEREAAAFGACAVPAMRADYFRYCAVHVLGGIYADADFRCLGSLRSLVDVTAGGQLFIEDPPGYLLNQFFIFRACGHPLLRLVLDVATINVERRVSERVQLVTGPGIFSALSVLHRLGSIDSLRREADDHGIERLAEAFCREAVALAPTPAGRKEVPAIVEPLFEAVGSLSRIAEAFEGVRIAPVETMAGYVGEPEEPLPYKRSEAHWINWQRRRQTIFR
jgi:hypothetical protein